MPKPYFTSERLILAHRGLALQTAENTLAAFTAAMQAGATHLETDVQASKDGVAVLFHDATLKRVFGLKQAVSDLNFAELALLGIPSLAQAMDHFPTAYWNLDIKTADAVAPSVLVLSKRADLARVLVSSFSRRRRLATLRQLGSAAVVTSADMITVLGAVLAAKLGLYRLFQRVCAGIDALQIPPKSFGMRLDRGRLLAFARSCGLQVHYWTVNDRNEGETLFAAGASGLVTDRCDLFAE